ncbi:MAG: 4-(cytidine 5'-diphospho)-2-C-methyl-D-erythritol kinase [Candidatus Nanopelagicales bacterium]|nr:4-(cytidine 5'-diphospho)-2-C-methyl-D-erythritol kinase [Candidatus Nanopelagicales bacterium]
MSPAITVRAPGKVNVQLSVGRVRDDGYHPLASVFHAVELVEEVTVGVGEPGSGIVIAEVSGLQAAEVPRDASNLAWRAVELVAGELGVAPDAWIRIAKGVPVAGGMAGGSADGAAALVACNELWGGSLDRPALAALALELGSDVPFSLLGGTALGLGRGERLSPLMVRGSFHWVFATASAGLSTAAVYRTFDRLVADRAVAEPAVDPAVVAALRAGDPAALGRALRNDLQEPALALRPTLADVLEAGRSAGALGALVSGSGPTCAFLAADAAAATRVAGTVAGLEQVRSTHVTSGPAPGARVVARHG